MKQQLDRQREFAYRMRQTQKKTLLCQPRKLALGKRQRTHLRTWQTKSTGTHTY